MSLDRLSALANLIDKYSNGDGIQETLIRELHCLKFSAPGMAMPTVYNPSLCVIVQGAKQVMLESEIYRYAPSEFLAVSVDLPAVGQVTEASTGKPYLCLQLDIDARQLSDLITQMDYRVADRDTTRGLFVGQVDTALMDSVLRLATLLETPRDIPVLAPMAIREVYYRLLCSDHGHRIAQIGVADSNMQRIARVLQMLKTNFARTVRIEELAEMANMSSSSFHQHFKDVTAMSPLQYQKRLRLLEARRIMLSEEADAAGTAYRVGYDSPSQFSREYSRMFGAPPVRDVETLRQGGF